MSGSFCIGNLGGGEGEEEEAESSDELACASDEVVAHFVGQEADEGEAELLLVVGVVAAGFALHAGEGHEAGGGAVLEVHRSGGWTEGGITETTQLSTLCTTHRRASLESKSARILDKNANRRAR